MNIDNAFDESHPLFNFMGITEWSFVHLLIGLVSGLFKKDLLPEWSGCIKGIPSVFKDIYDIIQEIIHQNWSDISKILSNVGLL